MRIMANLLIAVAWLWLSPSLGVHDRQEAGQRPARARETAELTVTLPRRSMLGYSLSSCGDIDQDGYVDFLAGDPREAVEASSKQCAGIVRLFSGRDGTVLRTYGGTEAGFGTYVASLGDCDGDGIMDIIVGSYWEERPRLTALSGMNGKVMYTIESEAKNVWPEAAVVGDMDDDGIVDLAACLHAGAEAIKSRIALFSGRQGRELWSMEYAERAGTTWGMGDALAGVDDVNGDGVEEIALVTAVADGFGMHYATYYVLKVLAGKDGTHIAEERVKCDYLYLPTRLSMSQIPDIYGDHIRDIGVGVV